jgi:hypothetical protein
MRPGGTFSRRAFTLVLQTSGHMAANRALDFVGRVSERDMLDAGHPLPAHTLSKA